MKPNTTPDNALKDTQREMDECCPCHMDITEYLHGSLPRLVRCNYNCPCSESGSAGDCIWPGHAALKRRDAAVRWDESEYYNRQLYAGGFDDEKHLADARRAYRELGVL